MNPTLLNTLLLAIFTITSTHGAQTVISDKLPDFVYKQTNGSHAVTYCNNGVPTVYLETNDLQFEQAVVHEWLHAVDCIDNGVIDGSLEPEYCKTLSSDCQHSWVYWAFGNIEKATSIVSKIK